jgi:hypothetical protein
MIQSDYILALVSKYEMDPLLDLLGLWTPAYARTVLQQMIPVVVTVRYILVFHAKKYEISTAILYIVGQDIRGIDGTKINLVSWQELSRVL